MAQSEDNSLEVGRQWLEGVLQKMSVSVPVTVSDETLEIDASDLLDSEKQALVGAHGITLDALQHLANAILNLGREGDDRLSCIVELDGYRQKRLDYINQIVTSAIEQVRSSGIECEVPGLNPAERRQVHALLAEEQYSDLETFSRGREPNRHLVVSPVREQA